MNTQTIGETAGQIWTYLKENGKTTLKLLEKNVEVPPDMLLMAVGWLAREGKLELAQEKRSVYVWLLEP